MGPSSSNANDSDVATTPLAGGFAEPSEAEWLALVDKVLKGAPIDKLRSHTAGGLPIEPLYTRDETTELDDGIPGLAPFLRGSAPASGDVNGWSVRALVAETAADEISKMALEALERGATELTLDLRSAVAEGVVDSVETLDAALDGVMADIAPIYLRSGENSAQVAAWMIELWERRGVSPDSAIGGFGADPIGTLAASGTLATTVEAALEDLGRLAVSTAATHPQVRSISVDSSPYANAGADEVQELALVLSTGVAYLRACAEAGLGADEACGQIELTVTVDADVFTGVAKLRALRRLWDAVAASCGASPDARAPRINVQTSETMMTKRDPWVNLLRVTAASLGAALGGADSLTTLPYDLRLAAQGELGRRMSRNTQLLLQEESNLARVADPMGGSWYIESLTDELIDAAWSTFQDLETAGGLPAIVLDGTVQKLIADGVADRFARIATRKVPITGVSEFPDINEPKLDQADTGDAAAPRSESSNAVTTIEPLPQIHWAQPFENLRDRSDAYLAETGSRPKVFLVNLGPVAKHTARATFAANFYAAGGIEATTSAVGSTTGFDDPQAAVADARESGASLVCVCSTDDIYAESAVDIVAALAAAGVGPIHLAGKPGDLQDALQQAGVDEFIFVGSNVIEILTRVHATIGTPEVNH
ncbi:MAG: methylmalonyl-CoA mutase small subunit [Microthrixaceae bacterium]|nr:methylmalonyl-CoA mutase small subunit [Microthrixaceae bacterium]